MEQDLLFIHENKWMYYIKLCILEDLKQTVDIAKNNELCKTVIHNDGIDLISIVNDSEESRIEILDTDVHLFSEDNEHVHVQIVLSIDDKKSTYNIYELTVEKIKSIIESNEVSYTLTDKIIAFFKKEELSTYNFKAIDDEFKRIIEYYSVKMTDDIISKLYRIKYTHPMCGYKTNNENQRLI